jgi:anti-sigma factor RsiW
VKSMQHYLDHPSEEALERFLLKQSPETELEVVETHILACSSCVAKLEHLETQIAVTKIALEELQHAPQQAKSIPKSFWRSWFTVPKLAFAGAMAALALGIAAFLPAQVTLSAYRGAETIVVPEWRPLQVQLSAIDLPEGPVAVQLVNAEGAEIWKGRDSIRRERLEVRLPRITKDGNYFLRLYTGSNDAELLREFAFRVK